MKKSLFLLLLCVSGMSIAASKTTPLSTSSAVFTYSSGADITNVYVEDVTFRIDFRTEQGRRWLLNATPVSGSVECDLTNSYNTKRLSVPATQLYPEATPDGMGVRFTRYTGDGTYRSPRINWGAYHGYGNITCWSSGVVLQESTGNIYVEADRDLKLTNELKTGLIVTVQNETLQIQTTTNRGLLNGNGNIFGLAAIDVKTLIVAQTVELEAGGPEKKIGWSSDRSYNVPMNIYISGNLSGLEFTSNGSWLTEGGELRWDSKSDIFVIAKKESKWTPGKNNRSANFTVSFP